LELSFLFTSCFGRLYVLYSQARITYGQGATFLFLIKKVLMTNLKFANSLGSEENSRAKQIGEYVTGTEW
jgi:hypothetical protein